MCLNNDLRIAKRTFKIYKKIKLMGIFVRGKMPNPTAWQPAHQVYYKTLNLIFSASKKNMVINFGAIHLGIMHAEFQPSIFNGVGGGGRRKDGWTSSILEQIPIQNF